MPVRIMGYDFGSYHQQINDGVENLTPVITIVLNMTDKRWNKDFADEYFKLAFHSK